MPLHEQAVACELVPLRRTDSRLSSPERIHYLNRVRSPVGGPASSRSPSTALDEAPHFLGWFDIKRCIGPRARNLALPDNCSIDEASRERGLSADQGGRIPPNAGRILPTRTGDPGRRQDRSVVGLRVDGESSAGGRMMSWGSVCLRARPGSAGQRKTAKRQELGSRLLPVSGTRGCVRRKGSSGSQHRAPSQGCRVTGWAGRWCLFIPAAPRP